MNKSEIIDFVERALDNDKEAMTALYNYTYPSMYSMIFHLSGSRDITEEILQESYITAFSNLNKLQYKRQFWMWLRGIAINKWRRYIQNNDSMKNVCVGLDSADDLLTFESSESSMQIGMENKERNDELWRAVNQLPEKQRVCIVLFYYEEMSVDEIAKVLNIPQGSVKSRLHYGRLKLKDKLKDNELFACAIPVSVSADSDMLAKILAALEPASEGTAIAVKAAASSVLLKISACLIPSVVAAGIAGMILLSPDKAGLMPPDIDTTPSSVNMDNVSTSMPTTSASTAAASSTTVPMTTASTTSVQTVTFDYKTVDGGIQIEKYTGTSQNVVIPSEIDGIKVVSIGESAFSRCRSLLSVSIPSTVTYIGNNAFRECERLSAVTIPSRVTVIGDAAFVGCSSLKSVRIPSGAGKIGIYAFAHCTSLESVTIGEGVRSINYCAFYDCPNLSRVTLPGTVRSIGNDAFAGASGELVLCVTQDTYSHGYALDKGFNFEFAG